MTKLNVAQDHDPADDVFLPPFSSLSVLAAEIQAETLREAAKTPSQTLEEPSAPDATGSALAFLRETAKSMAVLFLMFYFSVSFLLPQIASAFSENNQTTEPTVDSTRQ